MKQFFSIIILILLGFNSLEAQNSFLPNEGKMLTTVLVLGAILAGIFVFLFIMDRRLKKLENQIKDES